MLEKYLVECLNSVVYRDYTDKAKINMSIGEYTEKSRVRHGG